MPRNALVFDEFLLDCTGISAVLVYCGSDLHAPTFVSLVGSRSVVEVKLWLFEK